MENKHYPDDVKFKLDKEQRKVIISVKLGDDAVLLKRMPVEEFKVRIDQIRQELEEL